MSLDINRPDLTVGVVGTGAMGRGIAQVTAQGGIKAIMFDAGADRLLTASNDSVLVRDAQTREPADSETKEIARYCYQHGLLTITAGTFNNVIRILVPLVVSDEQFDEGLSVIAAALASVAERKQAALSHA